VSWALLIVEDDADIREELAGILAARGFHVLGAANGVDALDVARNQGIKPSLILLDLVMPVMDGVEFLERQHDVALLADVPVIVITAQATRVPRELPTTVCAVIEKPLPLAQLIHSIQDVCGAVPRTTLRTPARDLSQIEQPHQEASVGGAAEERKP
jgi:CheY-like chemotaxis protein